MYKVWMTIDGIDYPYGTYETSMRANEIAMWVRDERRVSTWVEEV